MEIQEWLGESNTLGIDIWNKKYRYNNESFDEWLDRVSGGDKHIRELIVQKKFLFAGRILAGRGIDKTESKRSLSNCYVIAPPDDNLESIFDTGKWIGRTYSYGGGCGTDISNLAPRGAKVRNAASESSGAVSFMDLYSLITGLISQNGRRGALMISMNIDHPDIEEFITIKSDPKKVTKANISVKITDKFMEAVEKDEMFELYFKREETGEEIKREVNARSLFALICTQAWDNAEPGVLFWDRITEYNLMQYDDNYQLAGTNPCVSGNTLLLTSNGYYPIKDLVNKEVEVWNGKNFTLSTPQITGHNQPMLRITFSNGINIECTEYHKFILKDGSRVKAKDLKVDMKIQQCDFPVIEGGIFYTDVNYSHQEGVKVGKCVSTYEYVGKIFMPDDKYKINERIMWLGGFISNAGTITKDGVIIKTTSDMISILQDVHRMMTGLGTKGFSYVTQDENNNVNAFISVYTIRKLIALGMYYPHEWKEDEILYPEFDLHVSKIEKIPNAEVVYCLNEKEHHSVIFNGVYSGQCGELPLPAGGSCLLSSINLAEFVNEDKTFNFDDFDVTVFEAIRAMNVVLDEGIPLHPLQAQSDSAENWRPIGLGIMGLADMLIKMGITYGSQESIDLCDEIGRRMAMCAIGQSVEEAETYGDFPKCDKYDIIRSDFFQSHAHSGNVGKVIERGIRNCQLLSIAPTGSLSTMLGISGGIEPIFDIYYERKTETLNGDDKYYKIYTQVVWDYMQKHGLKEGEEYKLPEYFVTAKTIDYRDRVTMQGVWQSHIDNSISSTVNLPNSATIEDVMDLYMRAWKEGCKGITIFREGCRRAPILNSDTKKEEISEKNESHAEDSDRAEQLKRIKEAWKTYSDREREDASCIRKVLDAEGNMPLSEKIKSLENRLENKDYKDDDEKHAIIRTLDWHNFVSKYVGNVHEQRIKEIAEKIINEVPMDFHDFTAIYKDWNRKDVVERITERWNHYVSCGDRDYYIQHMSYSPSFASYDEDLEWITYARNVIEFCKTNTINLVSMKILLSLWNNEIDVAINGRYPRAVPTEEHAPISLKRMLTAWKNEVNDTEHEIHLYQKPAIVETNPDGSPIDKKYTLKFQKDTPLSDRYPTIRDTFEDRSPCNYKKDAKQYNMLERGEVIKTPNNSIGKNRSLNTGCGTLHCQAFFDPETGDLVETYLSKGSTGGCNNFMVGLSRMISLSARAGVSIHDIVDQLKSSGTCPSYAKRRAIKHDTSKGSSCPVAVGYALIDMYEEIQEEIALGGVHKGSPLYYKLKEEKAMKEIVTDALPRVEWDDLERIKEDAREFVKESEDKDDEEPEIGPVPKEVMKLAIKDLAEKQDAEIRESLADTQSKDRSKIVDLITPKIQNGEITSYNELVREITNLLQPIDIGPYNPRYLYDIQETSSLVRQEDVDALTQSVYRKLFGNDASELSLEEMASAIDKKLSHSQDDVYKSSNEILNQIADIFNDVYVNETGFCPECGNPLTFEGGCNTCKCCGWSKCD